VVEAVATAADAAAEAVGVLLGVALVERLLLGEGVGVRDGLGVGRAVAEVRAAAARRVAAADAADDEVVAVVPVVAGAGVPLSGPEEAIATVTPGAGDDWSVEPLLNICGSAAATVPRPATASVPAAISRPRRLRRPAGRGRPRCRTAGGWAVPRSTGRALRCSGSRAEAGR
jgi:hypothetical protein